MLFDRCAAHHAALTRSVCRRARLADYGGNVSSCSPHEPASPKAHLSVKNSHLYVSECSGNNFGPEYIYYCRCSHRTLRMFTATQSDSDAALAKPASRTAFQSSTSDQQLLVAPFESSEFLCVTNIALPFPTMDKSTL